MCTVQGGPTRAFTPKRRSLTSMSPNRVPVWTGSWPSIRSCRATYALPPQLFPFVWACGPVDVERMDEGSRYLLGKRDFASLKNAGTDLRTTVRTILSITRTPGGPLPEGCLELTWRFEADGFLKQMVRNTVGLLVAVGRGKLEPADIPGILDACDRRMAPLTAPACGLTMKKVWYDDMFPLAASGHEGA